MYISEQLSRSELVSICLEITSELLIKRHRQTYRCVVLIINREEDF